MSKCPQAPFLHSLYTPRICEEARAWSDAGHSRTTHGHVWQAWLSAPALPGTFSCVDQALHIWEFCSYFLLIVLVIGWYDPSVEATVSKCEVWFFRKGI